MKIIKQYLWILRKSWKEAKWLHISYACVMLVTMMIPTLAAYGQKLFVGRLENGSPVMILVLVLVAYVAVKFLNSVFKYIDSFLAHKFIFRVKFLFSRLFHKKLYAEPQEHFYDPAFQDSLNRAEQGLELISFQCFSIMGLGLLALVLVCIQLPIVLSYSPIFLIYLALDSLFSLLTARRLSKAQYEMNQMLTRKQRRTEYFGNVFSEKSSAKEIRVFGAQGFFFRKWFDSFQKSNDETCSFEMKKQRVQMLGVVLSFFMDAGLLVLLFVFLLKGSIELDSFVFLYTFLPAVSSQCKELFQTSMGDIYGNYRSIGHYEAYVGGLEWQESGRGHDTAAFETLEAEHVSFSYPTGTAPAVKDVSLSIGKNEVVAILGYNGSGKSTLCKLLTGLLEPGEGSIRLNGQELSACPREEVSEVFGIAYQDFTRYLLSVQDNIGFGYVEKYQEETVRRAFEEAGCQTLHGKLPDGLKTRLGKEFYEDGIDLSGGEWQKLALARAYMGEHEVLVLDEPTASVDPIKEMEMLERFREVLKGRTAILISHRIGFARLADRIIMMVDGSVAESGSHEELLKKDGVYAKLFKAQQKLYV